MSSPAASNFGVASGVLGVVMVIPFVYTILSFRLPGVKLAALDGLLADTETRFYSALKDGLLTDEGTFQEIHSGLWRIKGQAESLRVTILNANNYWKQLKGWWSGLSGSASRLCDELIWLQTVIAKRSSRERARRGIEARQASLTLLAYQRDHAFMSISTQTFPLNEVRHTSQDAADHHHMASPHHADDSIPHSAPSTSRSRTDRNQHRQMLIRFGRQLSNAKSPRTLLARQTPLKRHRAEGKGRVRAMLRYFRLKFKMVCRQKHADGTPVVLDLPLALFSAMQTADDSESEWEDVDDVGTAQPL